MPITTAIVYQATVQYDGKTAKYIGLTEGDFKTRYRNHVKSFKHVKYKTETELSKLVWSLKEKNKLMRSGRSKQSRCLQLYITIV